MQASAYSYQDKSIALIGYGVTGKACAEYLLSKGAKLSIFDKSFASKQYTSSLALSALCKPLQQDTSLVGFDIVVVSPGVNLQQGFIKEFSSHIQELTDKTHKELIGDIELFAREINYRNTLSKPKTEIIAVTGSNGKSTVVQMLFEAFSDAGYKTGLGGNIGTSALTLLDDDYQVIILELSSFQLETIYSLYPKVACLLNVSSDHLDRHGDLSSYAKAKQRIYHGANCAVYNREDVLTLPSSHFVKVRSIGQAKSSITNGDYYHNERGIYKRDNQEQNNTLLFDVADNKNVNIKISDFQMLNMQVVFACASQFSISYQQVAKSLANYKGLPHRFQTVADLNQIIWINDSKATNPGASVAAIKSLQQDVSYIILIAGGDAKGADLGPLAEAIHLYVDHLVLLGKDAHLFTHFACSHEHASSIQDAVIQSKVHALTALKNSDKTAKVAVLLSPACASIDMFENYAQRGELFAQSVLSEVA